MCLIHRSGLSGYLTILFEQGQCRNAAYIILCGKPLLDLGIDLDQSYLWLKLSGGLLKCWCHHFTGTTPGGPEINQYGYIAPADMFLETTTVQLQWLARKQGVFAFATLGAIR